MRKAKVPSTVSIAGAEDLEGDVEGVGRAAPVVASDQAVASDVLKKVVVHDRVVPKVDRKVDPKAAENDVERISHRGENPRVRRSAPAVRRFLPRVLRKKSSMLSARGCSTNPRRNRLAVRRSLGIWRVRLKVDVRVKNSPNQTRSTWPKKARHRRS
jgi:hypothetical protein